MIENQIKSLIFIGFILKNYRLKIKTLDITFLRCYNYGVKWIRHITERSDKRMDFKISLKAARVNSNLTLKLAAKKIGVSESTLSNWEKKRSFPDVEKIKRIEEIYKIPYDYIFF